MPAVSETNPPAETAWAIIRVAYGNQGIAELVDGRQAVCVFRRTIGRPLCGDRVRLERRGATLAVCEIAARRNVFVRADRRRQKQEVASNLDQVLIVIAPLPAPSRDLLERYLVAVHSLGIEPVVVVNKVELLETSPAETDSAFSHLHEYRDLGYRVAEVSCKGPPGIDALHSALSGRSSILVGQSGVGKSSLVNRLIPDLELQTGALSRSTGKGTHTTTTTIMYQLATGGRLVDSPGVWEYGLWDMAADELLSGFPEFSAFHGHCRFNDCQHTGEPGCMVAEAANTGKIHSWRYQSYLRLMAQRA